MTWTGIAHLSRLEQLRHLNCSGIKTLPQSADAPPLGVSEDADNPWERQMRNGLRQVLGRLQSLVLGDR